LRAVEDAERCPVALTEIGPQEKSVCPYFNESR